MIGSFRHKGLAHFFKSGSKAGIVPGHAERLRLILARLNVSRCPEDMRLPALRLHRLSGQLTGFWTVDVSLACNFSL